MVVISEQYGCYKWTVWLLQVNSMVVIKKQYGCYKWTSLLLKCTQFWCFRSTDTSLLHNIERLKNLVKCIRVVYPDANIIIIIINIIIIVIWIECHWPFSDLPIIVVTPRWVAFTTSSIKALVPPEKFSNSKTPSGPFHTITFARFTASENSLADSLPVSKPCNKQDTEIQKPEIK